MRIILVSSSLSLQLSSDTEIYCIVVQALCQALGVTLSIAYLDQSQGAEGGPPGAETTEVNVIKVEEGSLTFDGSVLLLRPGRVPLLKKQRELLIDP